MSEEMSEGGKKRVKYHGLQSFTYLLGNCVHNLYKKRRAINKWNPNWKEYLLHDYLNINSNINHFYDTV